MTEDAKQFGNVMLLNMYNFVHSTRSRYVLRGWNSALAFDMKKMMCVRIIVKWLAASFSGVLNCVDALI